MKSPKKLDENGYSFSAVVATNGRKVSQEVTQPVLTVGTTNIVTLVKSSSKEPKDAGTADTSKTNPMKNTSKEREEDTDGY